MKTPIVIPAWLEPGTTMPAPGGVSAAMDNLALQKWMRGLQEWLLEHDEWLVKCRFSFDVDDFEAPVEIEWSAPVSDDEKKKADAAIKRLGYNLWEMTWDNARMIETLAETINQRGWNIANALPHIAKAVDEKNEAEAIGWLSRCRAAWEARHLGQATPQVSSQPRPAVRV